MLSKKVRNAGIQFLSDTLTREMFAVGNEGRNPCFFLKGHYGLVGKGLQWD